MGDETSTTTAETTPAAPEAAKTAGGDDIAKLKAENAALRAESADRRVKAREAEEAKTALEKAKAIEEGRLGDVVKAHQTEADALRAKLAELGTKATKADRLEAIVASEVASLEATVGEARAKSLSHLSPEDRLPILKEFAALTHPTKAPGPKVNVGNPAGSAIEVDIKNMTPEQRAAHFAGKSPEEIRTALGITRARGIFG